MPEATRGLQPEDLLRLKNIDDVQLAPDGTRVAYVVREVDAHADEYRSAIWVVATDGRAGPVQLSSGPRTDSTPRWSPDGRRLAFLSDRDGGRPQLYSLPMDGGEACKLTSLPAGAGEPSWSPDGTRLLFAAPVLHEPPPRDRAAMERWRQRPKVIDRPFYKFDGTGFLLQARLQLFVISAGGGSPRQITSGDHTHWQASWAPDGQRIAFARSRSGASDSHCFDIWTATAEGTDARQLTDSVPTAAWPVWSPDGQTVAFYGSTEVADLIAWVWTVPTGGGPARAHTAEFDREVPSLPGLLCAGPTWSSDAATLTFLVADAGNVHLARCRISADTVRKVLHGERTVLMPSVRPAGGCMAFWSSTPRDPGNIHVSALDGSNERRLTDVNAEALSDVFLPEMERRAFASPYGGSIDGFVIRPLDAKRPTPLLVDIHGGPQGFVSPVFPRQAYWLTLVARGWTILALNPHGSGSYGRAFNYSLRTRWGEYDFPEQIAAIDAVVDEGLADPQRLAVVGYSYGGYMTAWMIGHTDRFKAAVIGAPLVNLESATGTQDVGAIMDQWNFGDFFAEREVYRRLSPLHYADRVTTPTLLLHGEADDRCPIGQSEEFFAALMLAGKAPAQFVRYPGASHAFGVRGRPSHRIDFNRRVVDWVERWTLG